MSVDHKKSVEDLIGHAFSDKSFRDRLLAAPEETLAAEGYDASPELILAIRSASIDNHELAGYEYNSAERRCYFVPPPMRSAPDVGGSDNVHDPRQKKR